jgi:hypothetical protein
MSKERIEIITCPKCGHKQEFRIYDSLNGDLDPEAKKKLIDASLFMFDCEKCDLVTPVAYNLLYHDMTNEALVYLVAPQDVEEVTRMMDHAETAFGFGTSNYRKRIVTDQNSLREKAIIFDAGLDDRIIELVKFCYVNDVRNKFPEANIEAAFMFVDGERYMLEFVGEKPLLVEMPVEFYAQIGMQYRSIIEGRKDADYHIDAAWASKVILGGFANE